MSRRSTWLLLTLTAVLVCADELRSNLSDYLTRHGVNEVAHGRNRGTEQTKLLGHLMGTFDLLKMHAGCSQDCYTAGALHSIYGTSIFTKVSIEPTESKRKEIAGLFGAAAEELAFLFHVTARPRDIETGLLTNRFTRQPVQPTPSIATIRDLRLIEAANFIDQGLEAALSSSYPVIDATWARQLVVAELNRALRDRPKSNSDSTDVNVNVENEEAISTNTSRPRLFLHVGVFRSDAKGSSEEGGTVIAVPVDERRQSPRNGNGTFWSVDTAYLEGRLSTLFGAAAGNRSLPGRDNFGYVLRGEYDYGMPFSPLISLGMLGRTQAVHDGSEKSLAWGDVLAVDLDVAVMRGEAMPSRPSPVSLSSILDQQDTEAHLVHMVRFVHDLQHSGYAILEAPSADAAIIADAYHALKDFTFNVSTANRKSFSREFDGKRYVGFRQDAAEGREWTQLRTCRNSSCHSLLSGQPGGGGPLLLRMLAATQLLEERATQVLQRLALFAGISPDYAAALPTSSSPPCEGFSPSVHRLYYYHPNGSDFPTGTHADMGLLTLSPRSTLPALRMLHPHTLKSLPSPELGLEAHHWVVFCGEKLAYLSRGGFPAALHWVPATDGEAGRFSMPFFLRGGPKQPLAHRDMSAGDTLLSEVDVAGVSATRTTRTKAVPYDLMDVEMWTWEHMNTLRPWRRTNKDY